MYLPPDPFHVALPWRIASRLTQQPAPEILDLEGHCLLWIGKSNTGNGYGKVSWQGRDLVVHRVVYQIFNGPVDPRLLLDHRCMRRACCQPLHLEPVSTKVNTHRGRAVLYRKRAA